MTSTLSTPAVAADDTAEAPYTLTDAPPRPLGFADQFALWGNLAVSLALPIVAVYLVVPGTSLLSVVVSVVVGVALGSLLLGLAAVPGAATGAPAMVLLRGLLGRRLSYAPTALNIAQLVGWATVEIIIIAEVAAAVTTPDLRWLYVLLAGAAATALAVWPLGVVRTLRRYVLGLVAVAAVYLLVEVLRNGVGPWNDGGWSGFGLGVDLAVGMAVSWAPLAADYARHSRSERAAFAGAFAGYFVGGSAFFLLGVFALAAGVQNTADLPAVMAVPAAAALALAILAVAEVDEAFADIYSGAVSIQNIAPRLDRRLLAVAIGVLATGIALVVDLRHYETFLLLIGAVVLPLVATLVVVFFAERRRGGWSTGADAPARPAMLLPWLAGFATYQLLRPADIGAWWQDAWGAAADALGVAGHAWLNASTTAVAVSALVAAATVAVRRHSGAGAG